MGQLYIITNDGTICEVYIDHLIETRKSLLYIGCSEYFSTLFNVTSCISWELSNHWIYNVCYKNTLLKSLYDMCIKYVYGYRQVSNIKGTLVWQLNCWSLRYCWSIACRRCSNYIFILDLTPGFDGLGKGDCKTRWESFKFEELVRLI